MISFYSFRLRILFLFPPPSGGATDEPVNPRARLNYECGNPPGPWWTCPYESLLGNGVLIRLTLSARAGEERIVQNGPVVVSHHPPCRSTTTP